MSGAVKPAMCTSCRSWFETRNNRDTHSRVCSKIKSPGFTRPAPMKGFLGTKTPPNAVTHGIKPLASQNPIRTPYTASQNYQAIRFRLASDTQQSPSATRPPTTLTKNFRGTPEHVSQSSSPTNLDIYHNTPKPETQRQIHVALGSVEPCVQDAAPAIDMRQKDTTDNRKKATVEDYVEDDMDGLIAMGKPIVQGGVAETTIDQFPNDGIPSTSQSQCDVTNPTSFKTPSRGHQCPSDEFGGCASAVPRVSHDVSPPPAPALHNITCPFKDDYMLRDVGYQPELKILACISCGVALRRSHVYKHITGPAHNLKATRKKVEITLNNSRLEIIPDDQEVNPPPGRIAPIPWLQKEQIGKGCIQCNYCCENITSMGKHWQIAHPGERNGRKIDQLWRNASMQRFFSNNLSSTYFKVDPVLHGSTTDGDFAQFYNSLPDKWRNEQLAAYISTLDGKEGEFDLPPFLAKAGWVNAVKGCSIADLRAKVSPPKGAEKQYLHSIRGLGMEFLKSIKDLNHVHPIILEGLTKWRTYCKPFQLLTDETSVGNYGRSTDRLVMMVLRVMEASDPNFDEDVDNNFCANLASGLIHSGLDSSNSDSDSDMDSESDADSDTDSEFDSDSEWGYGDDDEGVGLEDDIGGDALEDLSWAADEESDDGDHEDEESGPVEPVPEDQRFCISLSLEQIYAAKVLARAAKGIKSRKVLLEAYRRLVFAMFTSIPGDASTNPFKSPMEAFFIARGLNPDKSFKSAHSMSSGFSHMQYLAMFSILNEVHRAKDSGHRFKELQRWLDPSKISAFYSIRRYQKLAWRDSQQLVEPPNIQFHTRYGRDFDFKGIPLCVDKFAVMFHSIFQEMKSLLEHDLLFDCTDEQLGVPQDGSHIRDNPTNDTPGYGFLGGINDRTGWLIMKHIMETPELRDIYTFKHGTRRSLKPEANRKWLRAADRFKELLYILLHCLCGMPKRGSEERRWRLLNTKYRLRNLLWMFNRLCMLGRHNKTSANSGCDKPTLHFVPSAITQLIRRFFSLAATHEAYLVESLVEEREENAACYLFSSMGKRWQERRMTKIIQQHTKHHLGYAINMQQLRHILPGIADHYNVGINSVSPGRLIQHNQMGHDENTGDRIYARTAGGHPRLTDRFCHDTMDFCHGWQRIWGFDTDVPDLALAQRVYKEFELAPDQPRVAKGHSCSGGSMEAKLDELQNNLLKANTKIESLVSIASALITKLETVSPLHHPTTIPQHSRKINAAHPVTTSTPNQSIVRSPSINPSSKVIPKVSATAEESGTMIGRRSNATVVVETAISSPISPHVPMFAPSSEPHTPFLVREDSIQDHRGVVHTTTANSVFGYGVSKTVHQASELRPQRLRAAAAITFKTPRGKLKDASHHPSSNNQNHYHVSPKKMVNVALKATPRRALRELTSKPTPKPTPTPTRALAVKCPECSMSFTSQAELQGHFKSVGDGNHALTIDIQFSYNVSKKKSGSIRFFRQEDLSIVCRCSTTKFTTRQGITDHISKDITEKEKQEHTHQRFKSSKPKWLR